MRKQLQILLATVFRNTSSVTDMLTKFNWSPLEQRGTDIRLATLFKIKRDLISVDTKDLLRPVQRMTKHVHPESFTPLQTFTSSERLSFFPRTMTVEQSPSINLYRTLLLRLI